MFKQISLLFVVLAFLLTSVPAQTRFDYPKPRKGEQVDDFFGTKVADPYRWMEETDSAETRVWDRGREQADPKLHLSHTAA